MNLIERPYVDVIIPNYNKSEFIEEAINSVVNQTYKNWYLYIIDNNSTDNSQEIINKFSNLKNIKIISLKKNKGPAFSRNYGMRISKSKYISFLDSDDGWTIDKLEKQIDFMEKNNLNFTYTDYTPFFQKSGKKKFKKRTHLKDRLDYKKFMRNTSINTTTMIIARSILRNHKFKKVKLEDYLFKCELLKNNNVAKKLNESLAFYRILDKSRSSQRINNISSIWQMNKKYNHLSFFQNIMSIFSISINSLKKYGIK